jgi:alpha-tubulin suppressor-like RCC1 family protein
LLPPPDVAVPTEVPSLAGSTEVACSENHCAARSADGRVRTWGNNLYRQLGVGTLPAQEPVLVTGINLDVPGGGTAGQRVTALRLLAVPRPGLAREGQTLSFHASATGRAAPSFQWLRNGAPIAGATGAAYTTPALAASDDGARYSVRVSDGSETVTSAEAPITVQAGRHSLWPAAEYTLALRNDGVLLGWGSNTRGQLASGAAVPGSAARQVASGMTRASSSATFATAVDGQGVWWGWGSDSDRWRAGTVPASGAPVVGVPAAVAWPARRVRQAEAALAPNSSTWQDSFVLLADGSVWALPGDRVSTTTEITEVAVQVPGLVDIVALSEGVGRRLAIRADGSVWTIGSLISARGVSYSASPFPGLANVRRVTCGRQHCLALLADGTLRAWGEGLSGELGQGAAASSSTPVVVTGLGNVTHLAVASDPGASFARTADGRVFSWGAGQTSGRAAPGTTAGVPPNALSPVEITSLSGSTELACSPSHCVARQADGSLWAWGANGSGQLGLPAPGFAQTPLRVTGIDLD